MKTKLIQTEHIYTEGDYVEIQLLSGNRYEGNICDISHLEECITLETEDGNLEIMLNNISHIIKI